MRLFLSSFAFRIGDYCMDINTNGNGYWTYTVSDYSIKTASKKRYVKRNVKSAETKLS